MKKRVCAILSALALAFSVPLPVSAEEYTYPKMADDYFALVKEYPDHFRMQGDSVYFMAHSSFSNPAFIVCSENKFAVQDVKYGYVFTPEESGRYIVTMEETTLDSVAHEDIVAEVQYKRYYSYIVDAGNDGTTVTCENVYHPEETIYTLNSCVTDGDFYAFVNGVLPNVETGNDRYFTTVFENRTVQSLFCLSYPYSKETHSKTVATSDKTVAGHSMTMGTASAFDADDILTLYVVSARSDGEVTLTANEKEEYDLIVENGIFRYRFEPDIQPYRMGDVNNDGEFNVADVVLLQKWLLAVPDTHLANWKAVDFYNDNVLNVFDLCLMKRELIQALKMPAELSITEAGGVAGAQIVYRVYQEGEKKILSFADYTENRDAEPLIIQISEDEYNEIMSEAYGSYLEVLSAPRRWSEISFSITLDYADGSQKKASSDRYPSVLNKLRNLLDKYQTSPVSYVEPDERFEFGVPFFVLKDVLKLYAGPDESYDVLGGIPANTRLIETGAMNGNSTWLFTEYNGQCGWINTLDKDGKMVIYFEEAPKKPVIYLYPEQETDVHVELELTESELNTTYPKYDNGWDVTAYPDGMLLNKADGSHHKYLFWDAVNCRTRFDFSTGFCVAGSDTESFLKEKLTYIGLNEQEMNEFIVYWLPLMEHNAYNLISFQGETYTNSAKLTITPTPDSECRVFMAYVPLENAVAIEPQQLETFERKGFTVVEWGGAEVNTFNVK